MFNISVFFIGGDVEASSISMQ